jgi:hypothetical protein
MQTLYVVGTGWIVATNVLRLYWIYRMRHR